MPSPTKPASTTTTTTTAVLAKAKGMSSHHHHQPPHHQLFQPQQEQHQHHLNPGMAAFVAPAEGPPSQPITMPYGTLQLASPAQQEAFAGVLGAGHIATGLSDDDDDEGDEDESATSGGGKRKRASSRATTKATKSSSTSGSSASTSTSAAAAAAAAASTSRAGGLAEVKGERDAHTGRRKIRIEFIEDDSRRHITFSKRKAGIMKKAYELATLTGTQVLLLIVSQTGLVYTFTTPKLQPIVATDEGRELIQRCLSKPDSLAEDAGKEGEHGDDDEDEGEEQEEEKPQFQQAMQQSQQQQQQQQHHLQQQHSMPIHQQQYAGMAPYPDPRLNPAMHGLSDLGDMSGLTMGGHSYAYPPHQQQQSQHHHQQSHAQAPPVSQQQSQPQQGGHPHQQQAPQQHHQPHMGGQTDQHAMPYGNYGL